MKKRNFRLGMIVAASLLVAGALGLQPPSASAVQCCYCETGYQTSCWSTGSSCSEAYANVSSVCRSAARDTCLWEGYDGACQVSTTITATCWFDPGTGWYVYSAYATHGCKWCEDCGPMVP